MKTLADLKRDLTPEREVVLKEKFGQPCEEKRTVFKVQTQSICFLKPDGKSKSWLELPKASLLEYDGKTFKIYEPGIRDLTEEEKKIMDNEPRDDKQQEIDALSDGNTMYYRRKRYYTESGHFYLFGTEKEQGKRLTHRGAGENYKKVIEDESIKGKLSLVYEFTQ